MSSSPTDVHPWAALTFVMLSTVPWITKFIDLHIFIHKYICAIHNDIVGHTSYFILLILVRFTPINAFSFSIFIWVPHFIPPHSDRNTFTTWHILCALYVSCVHYLTVVYVWPQIDIICIAWSWLFAPIQEKVNPKAFASSFIWFNKIRYLFHKYVGFWFMVENIRIVDAIMSNHQISVKAFSMKVSFAQTLRFVSHYTENCSFLFSLWTTLFLL